RAQDQLIAAEAERDRLRDALHEAERNRDAYLAQTRALSRALEAHDGTASILEQGLGGARARVADAIRVTAGFEAAVTAALGSLADAVLVNRAEDGLDVLVGAHNAELGRVDVVVAEYAQPAFDWPTAAPLTPLADVVDGPSGVLALLRSVAVVEDVAAARAALKVLPDSAGPVTLVTRAGDVVSASRLQGGSGRGRGRIELRAERDAAESEHAAAERLADDTRAALDVARANVAAAKEAASEALAALRAFDAELASRTETLNRARATAEAAIAEV
ncbi:MAG: chromosome segregation protein SMC, partial [Agromyces sp.]